MNITELDYFKKKVQVPSSKSIATRALILASRIKEPITIRNISDSTDVVNLLQCLEEIGLEFIKKGEDLLVLNSFPECETSDKTLYPGDGGTSNRFLISLLSRGHQKYRLKMDSEMAKRPMEELLEVLRSLGAKITREDTDLIIQGPVESNKKEIKVDSSKSSQFASSLLLSLDQKITPVHMHSSLKYFEITQKMKESFIKGAREFIIPTDMSSLSYPLALALVRGEVEIDHYFEDLEQPDSYFLKFCEEQGAKLQRGKHSLSLFSASNLQPFDIDCSQFPDLVPTLCFVATKIEGKSCLKGLEVLRYKESNRFEECIRLLELFGVSVESYSSEIVIEGSKEKLPFVHYHAPKDHRMVMLASMMMLTNSGGSIQNFECINKSYSAFRDLLS